MKMKLEFKRELEETNNRHPAAKSEQSQQRATKLPEITKGKPINSNLKSN